MITITTILFSVSAGMVVGILYGLAMQKQTLSLFDLNRSTSRRKPLRLVLFSFIRVVAAGSLLFLLLRMTLASAILAVLSFLVGVWAVILK